ASGTTGTFGTIVTFSCATNYALTNPAEQFQCGPNQQPAANPSQQSSLLYWSDSLQAGSGSTSDAVLPTCNQIPCSNNVVAPTNGYVTGSNTWGSVNVYGCNQG